MNRKIYSKDEYKDMMSMETTRRKYKNLKIIWDGKKFDSKKEFIRYKDLLILERHNEISNIERQKKFELLPKQKGERAVTYTCDFYYFNKTLQTWVSEDVKSPATRKIAAYVIKRKLFKFKYPTILFIES